MQVVHAGQLLKMDAGCERYGYVSDVTRTWPVSGTFSAAQRAVYETVLEVHRYVIMHCCSDHYLLLLSAGCKTVTSHSSTSSAGLCHSLSQDVGHWASCRRPSRQLVSDCPLHDCPVGGLNRW